MLENKWERQYIEEMLEYFLKGTIRKEFTDMVIQWIAQNWLNREGDEQDFGANLMIPLREFMASGFVKEHYFTSEDALAFQQLPLEFRAHCEIGLDRRLPRRRYFDRMIELEDTVRIYQKELAKIYKLATENLEKATEFRHIENELFKTIWKIKVKY